MCVSCCVVFFCKQKTAYELRISDWSSDVCSSDLSVPRLQRLARFYRVPVDQLLPGDDGPDFGPRPGDTDIVIDLTDGAAATRSDDRPVKIKKIGRASCRERGCQYV